MAELKPLRPGWELTAATASQISDGAAAVLIASPAAVRRHGFTPRARIHTLAVTGVRPGLHADRADPGDRAGAGPRGT